jgi:hypothetical protein
VGNFTASVGAVRTMLQKADLFALKTTSWEAFVCCLFSCFAGLQHLLVLSEHCGDLDELRKHQPVGNSKKLLDGKSVKISSDFPSEYQR